MPCNWLYSIVDNANDDIYVCVQRKWVLCIKLGYQGWLLHLFCASTSCADVIPEEQSIYSLTASVTLWRRLMIQMLSSQMLKVCKFKICPGAPNDNLHFQGNKNSHIFIAFNIFILFLSIQITQIFCRHMLPMNLCLNVIFFVTLTCLLLLYVLLFDFRNSPVKLKQVRV